MVLDSEEMPAEGTWSVNEEVAFLKAALHSRPVGIKKHWEMAALVQNMHEILGQTVDPQKCWKHLRTLYDLDALDEREELPFPNEKEEFALPAEWDLPKASEKEADISEDKLVTPKVVKDYSRVRDKKGQAAIKSEPEAKPVEKEDSANDSDEEDSPLIATKALRKSRVSEIKKTPPASAKKETPKRAGRPPKDASEKRDSTPATSKNKDDDNKASSKKESGNLGKRTLRSRGDDDGSRSPAPTPPPTKRARRI